MDLDILYIVYKIEAKRLRYKERRNNGKRNKENKHTIA